ncbi:MAG: glycosyltransferase family 2 protein [Anaerolineae bacterium]
MNSWPSISVIVLNYNGVQHLEPCFQSLAALNYPSDRLELVCVDNGSTDGSMALMEEQFPQVRLVKTGANLGFAGGNNAGARAARGEFIAFLNNDTRVPPDWLRILVQPCLEESDVVCAGSKIVSWDGRTLEFGGGALNFAGYGFQQGILCSEGECYGPPRETLYACGAGMVVQRDVFLESDGFDEDFFAFYEDSDLGWRLWVLGHRVMFVPDSKVYHRHHGTAAAVDDWKRRLLYERNALFSIVKNYDDAHLDRILPVALLLLLKRAQHMTGAEAESYRIAPERSGSPDYAKEASSPWTLAHYAREAAHTLVQEGPSGLITRAQAEVRRRQAPTYPPETIHRPDPTDPAFEQVPRQAIAHLLAADDLIRYWPRLMEKRAWIQAHRRRSDSEIFRLFGQPLEPNFFADDYKAAQSILVKAFEIDRIFSRGEE